MKMKIQLWPLLLLYLFYDISVIAVNDELPVLTIEDGSIMGKKYVTVGEGKTYYSFRGIPFAKPPTGDLRFKDPVKNEKWNSTLNATYDREECVQNAEPVRGSEDCLYINVYVPSLNKTGYHVMVWIYGGAFIAGNSSYRSFGPDYLLEKDVIFVSFNYRLGVFGFLSTEDISCPGNTGMKDQVLALNWVQKNIKYFGGDPNSITIFGESAGATSVSYLLQSQLTKGLFSAAIIQSGSSLCLWGLNRRARKTAFETGKDLGINTANSTYLVEKLRKVDYKSLQSSAVKASTVVTLQNPLAGIMFSPVIEPYHKGAFFTNYSDELLRQGNFYKVPILTGFTSNEGAAVGDIPGIIRPFFLKYDLDSSKLTPADLTDDEAARRVAGNDIRFQYFSILPIGIQSDNIVEFISDDQFNRPIRRMVQDMMNYTDVYFYKFSYEGLLGGIANRTYEGVGHAEDLGYLFRTYSDVNTSKSDKLIRERMVRLWTNFAKYHNPTPRKDPVLQNVTWYRANIIPRYLVYLNIAINMDLQLNPFEHAMTFWDNIYRKYGKPPYNTY